MLLLLLAACEGSGDRVITVELIDPGTGGNPALGVVSGTVTVEVREGGELRTCDGEPCAAAIERGEFTLELPLGSFETLSRVQGRIEGGPEVLVGAAPPFGFDEFFGSGQTVETLAVRIPMLELGAARCTPFEAPNVSVGGLPVMSAPRRGAGVAVRRNIALVVGGLEAAGPSERVDFFDHAAAEMRPPLDPVSPMGPTRGLTMSADESLFVGGSAFRFRRAQMGPPSAVSVALHPGASGLSALVATESAFAVVGGQSSDGLSWLELTGGGVAVDAEHRLAAPRTDPAAAPLPGGDLLVLGGAEAGMPTAELVPAGGDGEPASFAADVPQGRGGWLHPSPDGARFLWVGRVLEDGTVATDTVLLTGCPDCSVAPGPEWARARAEASGTTTEAGVLWIVGGVGSTSTDRVSWVGAAPAIEPGPELTHPRAGASVVEHASGVVAVFGGHDGDGLRDDLELCLAAGGLDPL